MNHPVPVGTLLRDVPGVDLSGDPNALVGDVVLDSRCVTPGALFAALPGERADGARFVPDALAAD